MHLAYLQAFDHRFQGNQRQSQNRAAGLGRIDEGGEKARGKTEIWAEWILNPLPIECSRCRVKDCIVEQTLKLMRRVTRSYQIIVIFQNRVSQPVDPVRG